MNVCFFFSRGDCLKFVCHYLHIYTRSRLRSLWQQAFLLVWSSGTMTNTISGIVARSMLHKRILFGRNLTIFTAHTWECYESCKKANMFILLNVSDCTYLQPAHTFSDLMSTIMLWVICYSHDRLSPMILLSKGNIFYCMLLLFNPLYTRFLFQWHHFLLLFLTLICTFQHAETGPLAEGDAVEKHITGVETAILPPRCE